MPAPARWANTKQRLTEIKEDAFRREWTRIMAARLKANYEAVAEQPLSPHLQELLQRLDSVTTGRHGQFITRSRGSVRR
jgi:hypothetical protein